MVNQIVSNVEVNIIGQIIVLSSIRSSKGNCIPNIKMNKQKNKIMATIFLSHRWPYIKSMVTQINKAVTIRATNEKHSNQIIFIWIVLE